MIDVSWSYKAHQAVHQIAVDGRECFVQCKRTRLVSLDVSTGEERWSAKVENPWGRLAIGEGVVVYLNQHSLLVAYDRSTGDLVWSRDLAGMNGWLSVFGHLVVVGGWRGYTPIRALSLVDGSEQWCLPDGVPEFVRTQIHGESRSLVAIAPLAGQELWFFDLDSGEERLRVAAPGGLVLGPGDGEPEPVPPTGRGPVVLRSGPGAFLVVDGGPMSVERVDVPGGVRSTPPAVCAGPVAYTTRDGELRAWWIESQRLRHLGKVDHNDSNHLPIAHLGHDHFVVGTSFGLAKVVADNEGTLAQRKIGKRVSTAMTLTSGVVVVGTSSGEVIGLRVESTTGTTP